MSKRIVYETFAVVGRSPPALHFCGFRQFHDVVGYFNGGGNINKLDVRQITHLNYSFGLIYNDEKGETNASLKDPAHLHQIWLSPKVESDLAQIPPLRQQNPDLNVFLSVGGWGARGFSGAAASKEARAVFIKSAQEIVDKHGLDGIDLDWEYPVNGAWGQVDSQPADRDNFTLLLKALRQAMGPQKRVTIAVGANVESPKSCWEYGADDNNQLAKQLADSLDIKR